MSIESPSLMPQIDDEHARRVVFGSLRAIQRLYQPHTIVGEIPPTYAANLAAGLAEGFDCVAGAIGDSTATVNALIHSLDRRAIIDREDKVVGPHTLGLGIGIWIPRYPDSQS